MYGFDPITMAYLAGLAQAERLNKKASVNKKASIQKVAQKQAAKLVDALRKRPVLAQVLKEALKEIT